MAISSDPRDSGEHRAAPRPRLTSFERYAIIVFIFATFGWLAHLIDDEIAHRRSMEVKEHYRGKLLIPEKITIEESE